MAATTAVGSSPKESLVEWSTKEALRNMTGSSGDTKAKEKRKKLETVVDRDKKDNRGRSDPGISEVT